MSGSARVTDVSAVREFRAALLEFIEDAKLALVTGDSHTGRVKQWLEHDRLPHWKKEIRRREELLTRAKGALIRAELAPNTGKVSVVDERKAVERAKRDLEEAERKFAATKTWLREFERARFEYDGGVQAARADVDGRLAHGADVLGKMGDRLDEYLAGGMPERAGRSEGENV